MNKSRLVFQKKPSSHHIPWIMKEFAYQQKVSFNSNFCTGAQGQGWGWVQVDGRWRWKEQRKCCPAEQIDYVTTRTGFLLEDDHCIYQIFRHFSNVSDIYQIFHTAHLRPHFPLVNLCIAGALTTGQLRREEAALRGARLPARQRHDEHGQRVLHCHWHRHWTISYHKVANLLINYFDCLLSLALP